MSRLSVRICWKINADQKGNEIHLSGRGDQKLSGIQTLWSLFASRGDKISGGPAELKERPFVLRR